MAPRLDDRAGKGPEVMTSMNAVALDERRAHDASPALGTWRAARRTVLTTAIALGALLTAIFGVSSAANAVDLGVKVRFAKADGDARYDPLAVFDSLGRPDLFLCTQQGGAGWSCFPSAIANRELTVVAARLPCANTLNCLFTDVPVTAGSIFSFEVYDADVSRNELVDEGNCIITDGVLNCKSRYGNAALELVADREAFSAGAQIADAAMIASQAPSTAPVVRRSPTRVAAATEATAAEAGDSAPSEPAAVEGASSVAAELAAAVDALTPTTPDVAAAEPSASEPSEPSAPVASATAVEPTPPAEPTATVETMAPLVAPALPRAETAPVGTAASSAMGAGGTVIAPSYGGAATVVAPPSSSSAAAPTTATFETAAAPAPIGLDATAPAGGDQPRAAMAAARPPAAVAETDVAPLIGLAISLEQIYTAAVPQQKFAFCRDPEGAVQGVVEAFDGVDPLRAMALDFEYGWRVANRLSEALSHRADTSAASAAMNRLMRDFDERPGAMASALAALEARDPSRPLVDQSMAEMIFRERCL